MLPKHPSSRPNIALILRVFSRPAQVVLNNATQETDNPDLRDRAYVYWRLLSTDPEAAKDVVLAEKPVISDDSNQLDPSLLDELLGNISTLSSVYHKPPEVGSQLPEVCGSRFRLVSRVSSLG